MKNPEDIKADKENGESDAEDEENIDPELKKNRRKTIQVNARFLHTGSAESYKKLVEYATKQPPQ